MLKKSAQPILIFKFNSTDISEIIYYRSQEVLVTFTTDNLIVKTTLKHTNTHAQRHNITQSPTLQTQQYRTLKSTYNNHNLYPYHLSIIISTPNRN